MAARFRLLTLGELRLHDAAGREVRALRRQERVLLVYLASRAPAAVSRGELAALLWGERDEVRARHSLRQALFGLRRVLGDDIEITADAVAVRPCAIELDVVAAAEDLRAGRPADALARWAGDFLATVDATSGEVLGEWIDAERAGSRHLFVGALDRLASQARATGEWTTLLGHARRWADHHPWDESAHVRLIQALRDAGHPEDAAAWCARARQQLGDAGGEPSHELRRLRLELERIEPSPPRAVGSGAAAGEPQRAVERSSATPAISRRRRWRMVVAASLLGLVGVVAGPLAARRASGDRLVLAVGAVRAIDSRAPDSLAIALPTLLTMHLSRVAGLEVVSRARMLELLQRSDGALDAARRAGARELLEGDLYVGPRGRHRLELRRVDVRTGRIQDRYSTESMDELELAHRTAGVVATSLGRRAPSVPAGHEGSIAAVALFEEGLRASIRRQDFDVAFRLFTAALARDSTLAMAALYAGLVATARADSLAAVYVRQAQTLAHHASERDRLYISAYAALFFNEPTALPLAQALAAGYPMDPAGPMLAGTALGWAARYPEAVIQLRRAITLDRAQPDADSAADCMSCAAYATLIETYAAADSHPAAIRVSREWAAAQPGSPIPLAPLAGYLEVIGRTDEAEVVRRQIATVSPNQPTDLLVEARRAIRAEDFPAADARLALLERSEDRGRVRDALWLKGISLRAQGRYGEALEVARRYRDIAPGGPALSRSSATPHAVVLMESGDAAGAAAMFDSMTHAVPADAPSGRAAREHAWLRTLAATSLAEAGDTARLSRLADSIEVIGRRSAYGRDHRVHHHVRGLLLRARGDVAASESEFRAAIYSPNGGYTRTNLELARVLVARGRAREAIGIVQSALRGPLDGTAYYVTRTELREALGRAFEAAGHRDSAATQYASALAAWRRADPAFAPRVARIRARLAFLDRRVKATQVNRSRD